MGAVTVLALKIAATVVLPVTVYFIFEWLAGNLPSQQETRHD